MVVQAGVSGSSSKAFPNHIGNVSSISLVDIIFSKTKVNDVQSACSHSGADEEVVRLNVSVNETTQVKHLNSVYLMIRLRLFN